MNDLEEILNVEVIIPQLEYITHEELTMSMEREANRKLKAKLRKNKKLKKGIGIKQQIKEATIYHYSDFTIEKLEDIFREYPLTPKECYD